MAFETARYNREVTAAALNNQILEASSTVLKVVERGESCSLRMKDLKAHIERQFDLATSYHSPFANVRPGLHKFLHKVGCDHEARLNSLARGARALMRQQDCHNNTLVFLLDGLSLEQSKGSGSRAKRDVLEDAPGSGSEATVHLYRHIVQQYHDQAAIAKHLCSRLSQLDIAHVDESYTPFDSHDMRAILPALSEVKSYSQAHIASFGIAKAEIGVSNGSSAPLFHEDADYRACFHKDPQPSTVRDTLARVFDAVDGFKLDGQRFCERVEHSLSQIEEAYRACSATQDVLSHQIELTAHDLASALDALIDQIETDHAEQAASSTALIRGMIAASKCMDTILQEVIRYYSSRGTSGPRILKAEELAEELELATSEGMTVCSTGHGDWRAVSEERRQDNLDRIGKLLSKMRTHGPPPSLTRTVVPAGASLAQDGMKDETVSESERSDDDSNTEPHREDVTTMLGQLTFADELNGVAESLESVGLTAVPPDILEVSSHNVGYQTESEVAEVADHNRTSKAEQSLWLVLLGVLDNQYFHLLNTLGQLHGLRDKLLELLALCLWWSGGLAVVGLSLVLALKFGMRGQEEVYWNRSGPRLNDFIHNIDGNRY
ncbi:hypothetical protein PQX77_002958 [Marasmius sp. AFHP31]|nr:hypothetical protein PQX77_002958 [Marasmius sp. AFHP31]